MLLSDDLVFLGVVLVTLVALCEFPVERDSLLRACASASDWNATNARAASIAAIVVLILAIIVQCQVNRCGTFATKYGKLLHLSANAP